MGKAPEQLKLVKTGRAVDLDDGDKARIVGMNEANNLIQIQLLSGSHKGQRWWMFATFFKPAGRK